VLLTCVRGAFAVLLTMLLAVAVGGAVDDAC